MRGKRPSLWIALVVPLLVFALACGAADEPTATPTAKAAATATATAVSPTGPAATPTPTSPAGPVAIPTATLKPSAPSVPGEEAISGGTMQWVEGCYPPSFDIQLLAVTQCYYYFNGKLYNNLFVNYEGDKVECEICTDEDGWRLENGGKTMLFNIKPGIKFHNGAEVTAADIAYSLDMLTGQVDGLVSPRAGVFKEYYVSSKATSRYELELNIIRPTVFVPKILSIASSAFYQEGTTREDLNIAPHGSGPYILKEAITGSGWKMERNPDYFKEGLPYIDKVEVTTALDVTTRVAAFLTHKTEWINASQEQYLSTLRKMAADGKISNLPESGGCGPYGIYLNQTREPFNNIQVRKALNLAVDREAVGLIQWGARAQVALLAYTPTHPGGYGHDPSEVWDVIPGWGRGAKKAQEVEEAKQILAAEYPNGLDIEQIARAGGIVTYSEALQAQWAPIGLRTTIRPVQSAEHQQIMTNIDYNVQVYVFCQLTRDPDEVVGQLWVTGASRNRTGHSNPEIDTLFVDMSSETDPVKRKQIFRKIENILAVETVAFPSLMNGDNEIWWWDRLQNFKIPLSTHSGTGIVRGDRFWLKD